MKNSTVCCGVHEFEEDKLDEGVFFHSAGKQKDKNGQLILQNDIMQTIWEHSVKVTKGNVTIAIPNPKTFQSFEYEEGAKNFQPPVPLAGFENSLFYRKIQFSEALASQISENQLKVIKNLPIRRSWFSKKDCRTELDFHLQWRRSSKEFPLNPAEFDPSNPNDYTWWTIKDSSHYPKMCAQYLEAVMNTHITIKDLNLSISLDDLERK